MMKTASQELLDSKVDRAAMVRLYEAGLIKKVQAELDEHKDRLHDAIASGGDVYEVIKDTNKRTYNIARLGLIELCANQLSYTYQSLTTVMGKLLNIERPPNRVASDIVFERKMLNDKVFSEGWGHLASNEKVRIEAIIRKGIADGKTKSEIALEVRKGNHHNITMAQSKGLVVTGITHVTNQADFAVYEANSKYIKEYQFIAILDSRTSSQCSSLNGDTFPLSDKAHIPPLHYHCRSTTVPVFMSWKDVGDLEGLQYIRNRNLTKRQQKFYDGLLPDRETYADWLSRQPLEVKMRHLGSYEKVQMLNSGSVFEDGGRTMGINELRNLTTDFQGDTHKFAMAKMKLDAMKLGASTVDDFLSDDKLAKTLEDYFVLQTQELDGTLSLTNFRGQLLSSKKASRRSIMNNPPREDQLVYNPVTGVYDDIRRYQPSPAVLQRSLRLLDEAEELKPKDREFILKLNDRLSERMSVNERAAVIDNLRVTFSRQRKDGKPWGNFKAVTQAQIKYDVMNVSEYIETDLRKDSDIFKKLKGETYVDPILGQVQLQDIHDNFIPNIKAKNRWEDSTAPKIARKLRDVFDRNIVLAHPRIYRRLSERDMQKFYLRFVNRLSNTMAPDRDQVAIQLGRDLYNSANFNGTKTQWYELGMKLLESNQDMFTVESFGVQKRRMRSKMTGQYFGQYYDTVSYNIRVLDPDIQRYSQLQRKVELGLRVPTVNPRNKLVIREGSKTYWMKTATGYEDTRLPITSTGSFGDFPVEFVDKDLSDALNWMSKSQWKVDPQFYDFTKSLLYFRDDKGKAAHYDEINEYKHFIGERGDAYERFMSMDWLRKTGKAFSNNPFVDHRGRIYDRGLISPQSGEVYRPFLSTTESKPLGVLGYRNLNDQIGAFLGGLSDELEGNYNSLTVTGRQKVAARWKADMIKIGKHMMRNKPNDIRAILDMELTQMVEGEEQGKFFRLCQEVAKIDEFLNRTDKPLAVIIKGNPKYLRRMRKESDRFYDDLKQQLELNGYRVEFDKGLERTLPDTAAALWVGHSRGVDRLKWAPKGIQTVALATQKDDGFSPLHYKLSREDDAILSLLGTPYVTDLALEQDASSSGAQIIGITTRNKKLAEVANVVPTHAKQRLYDLVAADTFNDPRFIELNKSLGLKEKDLRKAAKGQSMVSFYGAGQRTQILAIESKLAKILSKKEGALILNTSDRDNVVAEISAQMAKYERFDPDTAAELKTLRAQVKEVFDKGKTPSDDLIDQLWFLNADTKAIVQKATGSYDTVYTPADFKQIALIMSDHLAEQAPILKSFTKFYGSLAGEFLENAKPSNSAIDWKHLVKAKVLGSVRKGFTLDDRASEILGIKRGEPLSLKMLRRLPGWVEGGTLQQLMFGVDAPKARQTGRNILKLEFNGKPIAEAITSRKELRSLLKHLLSGKFLEIDVLTPQKMPKKWTSVPSVNFDGKVVEQTFTQSLEEKLLYKDKLGNNITNILQIAQKTEEDWWDEQMNKDGQINDIADLSAARTAFGVNANHSSDATLVKQYHLWGKRNGVSTSTIHDAFFANAADMLKSRAALKEIYARGMRNNVIKMTLDEMRARGLPKEIYDRYLERAILEGLIPVAGKSIVGGKVLREEDILRPEDILQEVPEGFKDDLSWYGIG